MKKKDLRDVLVNGSIVLTADEDSYMVVYSDLLECNMLFSTSSPHRITINEVTPDLYLSKDKDPESKVLAVYPKESVIVDKVTKSMRVTKTAKPSYADEDFKKIISDSDCDSCTDKDCPNKASKEIEETEEELIAEYMEAAKEIGMPESLAKLILKSALSRK